MTNPKQTYEAGVQAIKQGELERGQQLLFRSLSQNKDNIMAWLWLAKTQTDPDKRLKYIQVAMRIDPGHPLANKMYATYLETSRSESIEKNNASTSARSPKIAQISNAGTDDIELGNFVRRASMNISEQLLRLLAVFMGFGITGILLFVRFNEGEMEPGYEQLVEWSTAIINGQSPQGDQSVVIFILVCVVCFGLMGIYGIIAFVLAFGESLTIYQKGFEYRFFGMKKRLLWRDIKRAKVIDRTTNYRQGMASAPITMYRLQLKSDKGDFSLNKQFKNYRELGNYILEKIRPYAEISH